MFTFETKFLFCAHLTLTLCANESVDSFTGKSVAEFSLTSYFSNSLNHHLLTNVGNVYCFIQSSESREAIICSGWDTGASEPHLSVVHCGCGWSSAWTDSRPGRNISHTPHSGTASLRCGCAGVWSDPIFRQMLVHRIGTQMVALQCAFSREASGSPLNGHICRRRDRRTYKINIWFIFKSY